jgi:spore coat polysaccharide biosynthesis protein SpsF (cytidylyltransferase family)
MLAIIQARFSSQRLPGKVLKPLVISPYWGGQYNAYSSVNAFLPLC